MTRRPGITLVEVLVAILITGIGLLALLTLFPLGALEMAQAIKDDRTSLAAKNAYSIARGYFNPNLVGAPGIQPGIQNDPFITNNTNLLGAWAPANQSGVLPTNSATYFSNPYPFLAQTPTIPYLAPDLASPVLTTYFGAPYDKESYPIYVDPIGWKSFGSTMLGNVPPPGTAPPPGYVLGGYSSIPRTPLSAVNANQSLDRWCTLMDDITFQENGTPSLSTGTVQRENRYSWAWLIRRPSTGDTSTVDVTVVVYSGRSLTTSGETAYPPAPMVSTSQFIAFDPNSNVVLINYQGGPRPSVRTGTWILDATVEYYDTRPAPFNPVGAPVNVPDPHGFFYRVVGVTDVNSTTVQLELQTNPKKASFYLPNPSLPPDPVTNAPVPYGVLVVMENVAEVF